MSRPYLLLILCNLFWGGNVVAGDAFSVGSNANGIGDNGNLLALGALASARILGGGTLSAGEAYAQAVSSVGPLAPELHPVPRPVGAPPATFIARSQTWTERARPESSSERGVRST